MKRRYTPFVMACILLEILINKEILPPRRMAGAISVEDRFVGIEYKPGNKIPDQEEAYFYAFRSWHGSY